MGRVIKAETVSQAPKRVGEKENEAAADLAAACAAAAKIRSQAKDELIDLALDIAEKIVGRAVEIDASSLDSIYKRALGAARDLKGAVVSVHPEDRAAGRIDDLAKASGFDVAEDASVGRGGCRVAAGGVEVDASLEAILEALLNAMKGTAVV